MSAQEWKTTIETRLKTEFPEATVIQCTIVDASSGKYSVLVVADAFANKSPVTRHRAITKAVGLKPSSED